MRIEINTGSSGKYTGRPVVGWLKAKTIMLDDVTHVQQASSNKVEEKKMNRIAIPLHLILSPIIVQEG